MDDELLFLISGIAPQKGSLKTAEASCRTLVVETRSNLLWTRLLVTNQKQKTLVLSGVVNILEQTGTTRKGRNAALAVLQLMSSNSPGDLFVSDAELEFAKRLAASLLIELSVLNEFDDLFDGKQRTRIQSCDVAAQVLASISRPVFEKSSPLIRTQIASGDVSFLSTYVREVLSRAASPLVTTALALVEQLSLSCKTTASGLLNVVPLVVSALRSTSSSEAALKALMNVTNGLVDSGRLAVENSAVEHLMEVLSRHLSSDLNSLSTHDFDLVLICLSALGNLVELTDTGASVRITSNESFLSLICSIYSQALPIRARASLEQSSASDTVEAEWTPESLILAAHACLVIGCVCRDSSQFTREQILSKTPGGARRGFSPLVQVLETFLMFQRDAGVLTDENELVIRQVATHLNEANHRSMLPPSSLVPPDQFVVVQLLEWKQTRLTRCKHR